MKSRIKNVLFAFLAMSFLGLAHAQAQTVQYSTGTPTFYTGDPINFPAVISGFGGAPNCRSTTLPVGLFVNPTTCSIMGNIPFVPGSGQYYDATINSDGAPAVSLRVKVLPSGIKFSNTQPIYFSGERVTIAPQIIGYVGRSPQCTTSGLPGGLTIDPASCRISGFAPPVMGPGTTQIVTVTPTGGMQETLRITFMANTVTYSTLQPVFRSGTRVSFLPRLNGFPGGNPQCSATGLPVGLTIDPATCAIAGMAPPISLPTQNFSAVIRYGAGTQINMMIQITSSDAIVYSTNQPVFYSNDFVSFIPQILGYDGGRVPSCTATGLPPGLTIDIATCAIKGRAPVVNPIGQYFNVMITANGIAQVPLFMTILANGIIYPATDLTMYAGERINLIPTIVGFNGMPIGCSATGLPPGVQMDPMTCTIFGTLPQVPSIGTTFIATVTAPGTLPVTIQIEVLAP